MSMPAALRSAMPLAAILLAAALLLGHNAGNGFSNDDFAIVHRCAQQDLGTVVREDLLGHRTIYWRPGMYLTFQVVYGVFGAAPYGYFVTAIALHALLAIAVHLVLVRRVGALWSTAAAGLYLTCPAVLEAVLWPAAAFNVLPSALLVLLATVMIVRWFLHGGALPYAAGFACFLLSLTFRECAYNLVFVWLAGLLCLRGARPVPTRHLVLGALPFVVVVVLHFLLLNRVGAGSFTAAEYLRIAAANADRYAAELVVRPFFPAGSGVIGLLVVAAVGAAVWARGSARARFWFLAAAAGSFPYVLKAYSSRYAVFVAVPMAMFVAEWVARMRRPYKVVAAILVALTLALQSRANLEEQVPYRNRGEACRAVLASCSEQQLHEARVLAIDGLPVFLQNGLGAMLELAHGKAPEVIAGLVLLRRPPLLIHVSVSPVGLPDDTVFTRYVGGVEGQPGWDPSACRLVRTTREAIVGGLVPIFVVTVPERYEVVADPAAAAARIASREVDPSVCALLATAPGIAIPARPDARILDVRTELTELEVEVEASTAFLLSVSHVVDLASVGAVATADGRPLPILRANGVGNAIAVPAGTARVSIRLTP